LVISKKREYILNIIKLDFYQNYCGEFRKQKIPYPVQAPKVQQNIFKECIDSSEHVVEMSF
jgi:hypothetical protein